LARENWYSRGIANCENLVDSSCARLTEVVLTTSQQLNAKRAYGTPEKKLSKSIRYHGRRTQCSAGFLQSNQEDFKTGTERETAPRPDEDHPTFFGRQKKQFAGETSKVEQYEACIHPAQDK